MLKKCLLMGLVLILLFSLVGVVGCGGGGDAAAQAAISYLEANLEAVETVEVLNVDMTDAEHAIVKVKVTYGEGALYMPSEENLKVFLEKYGDEWEIVFIQ